MPQRRWNEYTGSLAGDHFTLTDSPGRRAVILSNNSAYDMMYRVGPEPAEATIGVKLEAGKAVALDGDLLPDGDVTLFCTGSGDSPPLTGDYTVYEVVG